jgi:two-component system sensor histidine kinase KdpD
LAVGVGLVVIAVVVDLPFRGTVSPATPALALTLPGVVAGVVGDRRIAAIVAASAALALNLGFIRPYGTLKIAVVDDVVALVVFTAVAIAVASLVALESDRRRAAEQRTVEVEALFRENETMREELGRLAVLEQVDAQRQALLRSVSHDLRTPLATIRAAATELAATAHDESTSNEMLGLIDEEAERLDRLVANLLSLSRIESGAMHPQRQAVPLDELIGHRVRSLKRLFAAVRVQVDVPEGLPYADADYTLLDQVVTNLLENAARHAPARSTVWVSARAAGGWIEVRIADEGLGVTEGERGRIFEPFRIGSGSASSGIGLAICKAIVEAHGGHIDVAATPGQGAAFTFTIPVRESS